MKADGNAYRWGRRRAELAAETRDMFGHEPRFEAMSDERFTTPAVLEECKKLAGVDTWDLDPAACEESHHALKWFSKADDGLKQDWWGRVWLNPPYSDLAPWCEKSWHEVTRHRGAQLIAMLVPASRTEQTWWQKNVEPFRDGHDPAPVPLATLTTHFLKGRRGFGLPGAPLGQPDDRVPWGVVLLVWRRR